VTAMTAPRRLVGAALVALSLGTGAQARAQPPAEGRSLLRDLDHPTTVIAGEADGASTVMNPAALGALRGLNGVFEAVFYDPASRLRGSGVGAFLGAPVGLRALGRRGPPLLTLGGGYQWLMRGAPSWSAGGGAPAALDQPFHKVTLALGLPLERWAPGLSVGLAVHRLWSLHNWGAEGLSQVDVAALWRADRAVGLGLVVRGLNTPRSLSPAGARVFQPLELDPEVALRPIRGRKTLELGLGGRIAAVTSDRGALRPLLWQPRARIRAARRGLGVFAEAEMLRAVSAEARAMGPWRLRWSAGLTLDFGHFGASSGVVGGAGADGGALRLRFSEERYAGALQRPAPRVVTRLALAELRGERGLVRLMEAIEGLPADAAVLVETAGLGLGWAQLEEAREALARLQAGGGAVAVYLSGGGLGAYYLASGADLVIAHPQRRLSIVGVRAEVFYFQELLERLGARGEFLRIAEFKGRPEQVERAAPSAAVAAQQALLLGDLREAVVGAISAGRRARFEAVLGWIDAAPLAPEEARRLGAVDALAFPDELEAALAGRWGRQVRLVTPKTRPAHEGSLGRGPALAVLHVEGVLREGESFEVPLVGQKIAGSKTLCAAISRLREDRRVKAVVVRISSVGGSVAAAAAITRELQRTAAVKPVVVSMGEVAASGGYFIATAGSVIFADALTKTGSIGVFRAKFDLSGLLARLGIGVDARGFGQNAGIGAWTRGYTPEERAAALAGIEASYALFVEAVGAARGMSAVEVDAVARGRVWGGARALRLGLVDRDGGLFEAMAYARAAAGLTADAGVIHAPERPGLVGSLRALGGLRPALASGEASGEAGALASMLALSSGAMQQALAALPASLWMGDDEELALASESITLSQ
jgi:protease-4